MTKVECPSCGAPVFFRGAASILAVCESCRSTLVRDGARLDDIGKMADLVEDASPLALGARGTYKGAHFAIVGRIQYRYDAGVWNEWYCLVDGNRDGWLTDASGHYIFTSLAPPADVPPFASLRPGAPLRIGASGYEIVNVETARVVAGAGELPFKVGPGWEAPVADLRDASGRFATIDYSEAKPKIYVGDEQPFDAFRFDGLRDVASPAAAPTAKATAFNCPSCGAPLSKRLDTTEAVGCGSCGAVIDVNQPGFAIISRAQSVASQHPLSIPLGTRGRIEGAEYEAVGYMTRSSKNGGESFEWGEYLLHNVEHGYRWISEYQGHFSLLRDLAQRPVAVGSQPTSPIRVGADVYRHFEGYDATVTFVWGEFYWRVKVGETCRVDDYVAPPRIVSREVSGSDATWSIGEYIEPEALWKALALTSRPPSRVGIAPNQPWSYGGQAGRMWRAFALFALVALILQLVFRVGGDAGLLQRQVVRIEPGRAAQAIATPAFEVRAARPVPIAIHSTAPVDNSWVTLDMALVDELSGAAYAVVREIGYYHGSEGGESWSEGSRDDSARIGKVPAGRYHLEIEAEADPRGRAVSAVVEVRRAPPDWINFALALVALALLPVLATVRAASFEARRWGQSDQRRSEGEDDED